VLAAVLLATSTARSAPTFEADHPELAKRAEEAWARLEACAGRPAPKIRSVELSTRGARGWPSGRAYKGFGGLLVETDGWPDRRLLRHELAHGWASHGEIREALADVLADCAGGTIAEQDPDWGDDFEMIPEPRGWTTQRGAVAPVRTSAGYLSGLRLLRSVIGSTSLATVFADPIPRTWDELSPRLEPESSLGLSWYLDAGSEERIQALADPDYDGVTCLAEWIAGTDPATAYSFGRATPDGLPDKPGLIDVPRTGAVCVQGPFALVHNARVGRVPLLPRFRPDGEWHRGDDLGAPFFVVSQLRRASGGMEVLPTDPTPACTYRPGTSILTWPDPVDADVVNWLADSIEQFDPPRGTAVWLGAPSIGLQKFGIVRVSADQLKRAQREDAMGWLGALVFAQAAARDPDVVDFDRVEALARQRTGERREPWLSANEEAVTRWESMYASCPDAWATVLELGSCEEPVGPMLGRRPCAATSPWRAPLQEVSTATN
jgi:hypothetical protein